MAHRSKKKHLKHLHRHEPATPPSKSPVAKAESAAASVAKNSGTRRRSPELQDAKVKRGKQKGIVRRIASAATRKVTAKPRKIVRRVKALLGAEK